MSLSDVEIAQIAGELAPRLAGGIVGKAYLPDAHTLVLEIGRERLLLSAHPRASRLALERTRRPAPATPPPFAMAVRRRLAGRRVASLAPLEAGERVVVLTVAPSGDRLVAELTGPHANLFLVDAQGRIAGALRRSGSTTRALAPGHPYLPPAPAQARWRGRARFGEPPGVAERAEAHYEALLAAAEEQELRERAAAQLRREIERLSRREQALLGDLARVEQAAGLRKHADLLLAHAHELPGRGATSVTVSDDFEDGTPLTIPVDPALDARGNAVRLYKRHKRLTAGRKHVDARLAATRAALTASEARLHALPSLPLDELRALAPAPRLVRRRARAAERLPYREYQSASGDAIWVGRGGADNDALTFRHARGNDLWLHCRDAAGAHVVVPRRTSAPIKDETFLDAATLAAHFSRLASEEQVDVLVTHVKYVRRARGAPPGRVFCADARTTRVRMEPARVQRLLARASLEDA